MTTTTVPSADGLEVEEGPPSVVVPDTLGIVALGEAEDEIEIAIDYAIIEHFSQHLYGSPNKAVEELVANGYDAGLTRSSFPDGLPAAVTDVGYTLDVSACDDWKVAASPAPGGPLAALA